MKENGGMPQGTWLGPYVFITLIDDLSAGTTTFKFVDDVTLTELMSSDATQMQSLANQVMNWSQANFMNINSKKTKEMLLGPISRSSPPPPLMLSSRSIERVTSYKLLGVTITDTLDWDQHIDAICTKASKRLHFLKMLKRSAMAPDDLLQYYKSVVRPVLEYACPAWQSSLNGNQRNKLEAIQKRALRIISGYNNDLTYENLCALYNIETINFRLDLLTRSFFYNKICGPNDCLHWLLPSERQPEIVAKLRHADKLPGITCRTERFRNSFIPYCLNNYQ
jgi:hypothetical protein